MQSFDECVQFFFSLKKTYLFCCQSTIPTTYVLENIEEKLTQVNSEADF